MPVFKDPDKLAAHLKKAMDAALFETIKTSQADLGNGQISPYRTGRLRSSWFAAEGQASNAVAPEGADSPNTDAESLRVDSRKTYHLTNNLPYAQTVALGEPLPPSWQGENRVKSGAGKNWFIDFVNNTLPQNMRDGAQAAKEKFDL